MPTQPPPLAGDGLKGEIVDVVIDGGAIAVTFSLTDADGVPVQPSLARTTDPQLARVRFTIAHVEN
ncbi:MAG TPA: hypothetical protein VL049_09885, partial [Candidatus Dormibacteraeota bacterium]|nr:hypothetical protein [Candidatus Dormibacteraeota bacterium]